MSALVNERNQAPTVHTTVGDEEDRRGLDLLAATIDEVAENLPASKLISFPPQKSSPSITRRVSGWRGTALAASLAGALLAWPTYLGMVRLPQVEQQLETARSVALSSGPVDIAWLSPPRQGGRSTATAPTIRIEKPQSAATVWLLELPVALHHSLQAGVRIELRALNSQRVDVWQLDGEELTQQLKVHDGVPILLPTSELSLGPYRLSWQDETGQVISSLQIQLVAPS